MNRYSKPFMTLFVFLILYLFCDPGYVQAKQQDSLFQARRQQVLDMVNKARGKNIGKNDYIIDSNLHLLRNALKLSTSIEYNNGVHYSLTEIGIVYSEFGIYDSALIWFRRALAYAMFSNFSLEYILRPLVNIGDVYLYQGQYNEAIIFYLQVLESGEFGALEQRSTADFHIRTYNNIGSALLQLNEPERALIFLNKGIALARKMRMPEQEAHILNNMAKLRWRKGEKELAWKLIHQAKELAEKNAPSRVQYTALQTMAEFHIESGHHQAAIEKLQFVVSDKIYMNPYYRSITFFHLGTAYFALRQYNEALDYLTQALQEATKSNAKKYMLYTHIKLAALYEALRRLEDANTHHKIAYMLNDSLLNKQKSEIISLLETKYKIAEKDKEIYKKQFLITTQENNIRKKNIWIYSITAGFSVIALLGYNYYRAFRQRQRIDILKAMIDGEEKERKRIGQDLHDGIGGQMAAINMHFGAVQKRYENFIGNNELEQIIKMMENASEEIRRTARNLIPDMLSKYSFSEAVCIYCDQLCTEKLQVTCEVEDFARNHFGKNVELVLYRIIQELLQNIVKHSLATEAVVEIRCMSERLDIVVEDNGKGFCDQATTTGTGLNNIRSRVKMLRGEMVIESAQGTGTIIFITFDMHKLNLLFAHEHQDRNHG